MIATCKPISRSIEWNEQSTGSDNWDDKCTQYHFEERFPTELHAQHFCKATVRMDLVFIAFRKVIATKGPLSMASQKDMVLFVC